MVGVAGFRWSREGREVEGGPVCPLSWTDTRPSLRPPQPPPPRSSGCPAGASAQVSPHPRPLRGPTSLTPPGKTCLLEIEEHRVDSRFLCLTLSPAQCWSLACSARQAAVASCIGQHGVGQPWAGVRPASRSDAPTSRPRVDVRGDGAQTQAACPPMAPALGLGE